MARYVVREGKVRGQGRYLSTHTWAGVIWVKSEREASHWLDTAPQPFWRHGGRVVKLVPKKKKEKPLSQKQLDAFNAGYNKAIDDVCNLMRHASDCEIRTYSSMKIQK